uniref:Fungal lipase-type domain-containing protein n=1 Tax=Arcella intermedia TaxID=1963864 RepID=A0A6B2LDI9_9EUKA
MKLLVLALLVLDCVSGFNLKEGSRKVANAFAAYCPNDALKSWNCYWCNDTNVSVKAVVSNTTTLISAYVGIDHTQNEVVVSFRGTIKNIQNWVIDLNFAQTLAYPSLPDVSVHEGFWFAYLSISTPLIKAIKQTIAACPNCNSIVYTGHSLGGALASLALMDATYIYQITQPAPVLYTFGQPRTGSEGWVKFLHVLTSSITRVVHNADIVPHVPPRAFGYQHLAVEVWMAGNSGAFTVCDGSGEDPNCSDKITSLSVSDHLYYIGHNQTLGTVHGC